MNNIDLSVVIPSYNSSATIVEAMDSVVRECIANYYQWELIVVDDGAKDDSVAKIEKYIAESPNSARIQLIRQPNGGAAAARNTGIRAAKGEFIAFNDSDDEWLPGKLKLQMEYIKQHREVDMVGSSHHLDQFPSTFKKLDFITRITIKDLIRKNYFSPPTVIIRRRILDETGLLFDATMRGGGEEGSLFYPLAAIGHCVLINTKVAQSITGKQQWGECGLTGNIWKMECGVMKNKRRAYREGYITFGEFITCYSLSYIKVTRRFIIKTLRKIRSSR